MSFNKRAAVGKATVTLVAVIAIIIILAIYVLFGSAAKLIGYGGAVRGEDKLDINFGEMCKGFHSYFFHFEKLVRVRGIVENGKKIDGALSNVNYEEEWKNTCSPTRPIIFMAAS